MGNRDRHNRRQKATLKKETIRKLDLPALSPDDLAKVVGGKVPRTVACITLC